jgi:hypothetical protein
VRLATSRLLSTVAREAALEGITRSVIHNVYPPKEQSHIGKLHKDLQNEPL